MSDKAIVAKNHKCSETQMRLTTRIADIQSKVAQLEEHIGGLSSVFKSETTQCALDKTKKEDSL
uniref:Uncharacterized protein n=1 Tax=Romanomermis culicivorax TaxID=13658 RepID=A0A915HW12_ROMCU